MGQIVAIIGASDKPDRYAYKAADMLEAHGHELVLVNPFKDTVRGQHCLNDVSQAGQEIDIVTVYVNAERFKQHLNSILQKKPRRVIFNPGAEAPESYASMEKEGIEVEEACTLVLLGTGQF